MKRSLLWLGLLVAVIAVGGLAWVWISGGSGEPSRAVEADALSSEPADDPEQEAAAGEGTGSLESTGAAGESASSQRRVYDVTTEGSEVRFLIDEVLRGEPTTVVGTTDQIDGSIAISLDPPAVEIGEFVINVRTIRTDNEVRDRTIRSMILQSNRDEFEFSTFQPRSTRGVPDELAVGDTLALQVVGDLTVRNVTSPVTFEMTLELVSQDLVTGTARTSVTWQQFDITIPYVGGDSIVEAVDDELRLEMDYRAPIREASP